MEVDTLPRTPPITVLVALALSACVPSLLVGDKAQGADETTTTEPTTGDAPTGNNNTGEPAPAVCGDGVVGDGEACDDGNDEPNDGCDAACARTGAVVWTRERSGTLVDVAVAADGTILACGRDVTAFLSAFAPDGAHLWTTQVPGAGALAVAEDGTILVSSPMTGVHAFAADGAALWTAPLPLTPPGVTFLDVVGVAVTDDAVYAGGLETGPASDRLVVRRHDLATGDVVWETRTAQDEFVSPGDLTVIGDHIVAVGRWSGDGGFDFQSMLAVLDTSGALLSLDVDDPAARTWFGVTALGGGELVISGQGSGDPGFLLRRLDADQAEVWTVVVDGAPAGTGRYIATGPDAQIAAVGGDLEGSTVRLYDGTGALQWTSTFPIENIGQGNATGSAVGAAFGPDFLAVGGTVHVVDEGKNQVTEHWWLRRFALD